MAKPIATAGNPYSTVPLAFTDLPVNVALTGSGSDPDLGAITGYEWALVYKPPGSSAALSSTSVQNPTLNDVDTWGNYLLFLVVTDDQAEESETNIRLAPNSAITIVRVYGPNEDIQKLAPGERSYHTHLHEWAAVLDSLSGRVDATPSLTTQQATSLLTGVYATDDGLDSGVALHLHTGEHVDQATEIVRGTLLLDEAPVDVGNPRAVTRDRMVLTGNVTGAIAVVASAPEGAYPISWVIREACHLVWWAATLRMGGPNADAYEFELCEVSPATFTAEDDITPGTVHDTLTLTQGATSDRATLGSAAITPVELTAGNILGVRVKTEPASPGEDLTITVVLERRV